MISKMLSRIFLAISVVMFIIVSYMLILKLTGHSPSAEEVLIGFSIAHFSAFMAFAFHSAVFQGKTTATLSHLRNDINELKNR